MTTLLDIVGLPRDVQQARGLLFTPREIAQQPETWARTAAIFAEEQERLCSFLQTQGLGPRADPGSRRPTVFLIGAGTSDYIGHALALLLRQQWGAEVFAIASTDLLPNMDETMAATVAAGQRYLWISFSRSGDSPEGVAVLEQAMERYPEVAHLVVSCNPKARMAALADGRANACVVVLDDAVNDRSLAMTSSFTNMIVMGHCLAHAWSRDAYLLVLAQLRQAATALLRVAFPLAEALARERYPRMCLVGTGPQAAVAKESALKVLEMSAGQVKTMAETTLGLRHGPMAALDRRTLFVCFISSDARRQGYAADLLRELGDKQVTAARVAVGPASAASTFAALCEHYLPIEADLADGYRPVVDVIAGQLLGLCTSIELGLHPDAPSPDGVINRVVQDFAIY
jgi:tagatose-6-phosphate ketose/aldose isomerase